MKPAPPKISDRRESRTIFGAWPAPPAAAARDAAGSQLAAQHLGPARGIGYAQMVVARVEVQSFLYRHGCGMSCQPYQ